MSPLPCLSPICLACSCYSLLRPQTIVQATDADGYLPSQTESAAEKPPSTRHHRAKNAAEVQDDQNENPNSADVLLNAIIANLNTAPHDVNVAVEHDNSKLEREYKHGVQAYAKIAGPNWTFYVKTLRINIGRPPDVVQAGAEPPPQSSPVANGADSVVHIDLGPSKFVSRQHATIDYHSDGTAGWQISVHGRNGVKINEDLLKRGASRILQSGDVLEIGGTQMMFVTPNDGPRIHPMFLPKAQGQAGPDKNGVPYRDTQAAIESSHAESAPVPQQRPVMVKSTSSAPPASSVALAAESNRQRSASIQKGAEVVAQPKQSPIYNRGLMLETTEEIDYSQESAKDIKPPYSYATMIGQAILASEEEKLTLNAIYQWIMDKYSFYRRSQSGWQVRLAPMICLRTP